MSEERIRRRITEDAEREAEAIVEKAKESARSILEEGARLGAQDAGKDAEAMVSRAREESEALRRRIVSEARMKGGWQVLSEKRALMEKVLEEAMKALKAWSESEDEELYAQAMRELILKDALELGGGELEVLLNQRDSRLRLGLDRLSREVEKRTGRKTRVSLAEERLDASGGFILRTADGKISIDETFEGIMGRRRRRLEAMVARVLFRD